VPPSHASLLATEDYIDALKWAEGIGGLCSAPSSCQSQHPGAGEWWRGRHWVDFLYRMPRFEATPASASRWSITRISLPQAGSGRVLRKIWPQCWRKEVWRSMRHRIDPHSGFTYLCGATIEQSDVQS